jgi:predicted secreted Zn-dependent protease
LQRRVREICEAFEIVALVNVSDAAVDLRRRLVIWNDWISHLVISPARDARAEYWRTLALTQRLVAEAEPAIDANGLVPMWQRICREAGGRLPRHYLPIGLLGLRCLPKVDEGSELPWVSGLAQWALSQHPSDNEFKMEWLALKPLYPRAPDRWRRLVSKLLSAAPYREAAIEPPGWWSIDPIFAPMIKGVYKSSGPPLRSPSPQDCKSVIDNFDKPFDIAERDIDALLHKHREFLTVTGDQRYFVRAIHALGSALIERGGDQPNRRARKAQALAREGIGWAPYDHYLWSLWHNALAAEGKFETAELVAWEHVRIDSTQPQARNQLAGLLALAPERQTEAEAILKETVAKFPNDAAARNQLAGLLALAPERRVEAEAILKETVAKFPDNEPARNQLAGLLTLMPERRVEAEAILKETVAKFPNNAHARAQLAGLLALMPERRVEAEALLKETVAKFPNNAHARTQLAGLLALAPERRVEAEAILKETVAKFPNDSPPRTQLAGLLAQMPERRVEAEAILKETVAKFPNDAYARNHLAGMLALMPERRVEAEAILKETIAKFPNNAPARNQLAGLLTLMPERRVEAEAILKETVAKFPNDAPAQNQLAGLLTLMPERRVEAEAILKETVAKFPNDAPAQNQLAGMPVSVRALPTSIEEIERGPEYAAQEPSLFPTDGILQHGHIEPRINFGSESVTPMLRESLSDFALDVVARRGALRRISFRIGSQDYNVRDKAIDELKNSLRENPNFSYADLLAARCGLRQAANDTLPTFAAAFEDALASEDREKLEQLARRQPRLQALVLVARAVLGDAEAARMVREWLQATPHSEEEPAISALRIRLTPVFTVIEGGRSVEKAFVESRNIVVGALRDSNEATIGDEFLAA